MRSSVKIYLQPGERHAILLEESGRKKRKAPKRLGKPPGPKAPGETAGQRKEGCGVRQFEVGTQRVGYYLMGVMILAAGLVLNTKTGLGATAINSVPYSLSLFTGITMGTFTTAMYLVFVAIQIAIRRRFRAQELLQLPFSVVFGWVVDVYDRLFAFQAGGILAAAALLALAIGMISLGVILTVSMNLVPNPADGFVNAIAEALGAPFSRVKNIFDIAMAAVACVIGLVGFGQIAGVGVGTLLSALLVGPTTGLMKEKLFPIMGIEV